jgi:hypothetical protein
MLPGLSLDVLERYGNLDVCCYIRNPQQVSERDRIMEWLSKGRDERCNVPYVGSLEGYLEDAADSFAVRQYIVIVVAPFAGGARKGRARRASNARSQSRSGLRSPVLASSMIHVAAISLARSTRSASPRATRTISNATPILRVVSGSKLPLFKNAVMGMSLAHSITEQSDIGGLWFVRAVADTQHDIFMLA